MRIKSENPALPDFDMTPMIDIVFQLIAFFMLISNFEQTQADERVKLPRDELAKPPLVARENELTLNVGFLRDSDGRITSEALVFYTAEDEPVPVMKMDRILQREARIFRDLEIDPSNVTVVVRADAELPTGLFQELIRMGKEAGFEKFAWKATQKLEP